MNKEQEHRELGIFIDGLHDYMMGCNKIFGKPLVEQEKWEKMSQREKSDTVSYAMIRHAVRITQIAHDAIHGLTGEEGKQA